MKSGKADFPAVLIAADEVGVLVVFLQTLNDSSALDKMGVFMDILPMRRLGVNTVVGGAQLFLTGLDDTEAGKGF